MILIYLVVALITLGDSTSGLSNNATLFALMSKMHEITGMVTGWTLVAAVVGLVVALLFILLRQEGWATLFSCLAIVPAAIFVGTLLTWVFTGGMVANFSPQTGPTSVLFWLWLVLGISFGMS